MEEHIKKKQKFQEDATQAKSKLKKEEEDLEKQFYAEFLQFLKEKAKKTIELNPREFLISEESIDFANFILSIKSLDFGKSSRFWSSFTTNLQSHSFEKVLEINFEDESKISLVYSTHELQKRYNDSEKGLTFEYSKISKNLKKLFANVSTFWKDSWKLCFEFLFYEKKYIKSSNPEYEREEIIIENKLLINDLFDSMLLNHVFTRGKKYLPILE